MLHNHDPVIKKMNYRFISSLFIISLIIGVVEGLVMLLLNLYKQGGGLLTELEETAMDTFLLTLISAPLLWFFVLKPLVMQINQEHKVAQEQSRLNTELRNALNVHSLISIADTAGRIIHANDKFCEVSGYTQDELLGKDHRILNSSYHDKAYIGTMWQTITQGLVWQDVFCNRRKDGSFYWVNSTIVPLLDDICKPYQYISIRQDITAQKEANSELIMLKRAVDASAEMILLTNGEGYIQYANPALCQATGWTQAMLIGRSPNVLNSPNADVSVIAAMRTALHEGKSYSGRILQRCKGIAPLHIAGQTTPPDSLEFWAELNITPVFNRDGSQTGYVQIQRDISEQVNREAIQWMEKNDTVARLAIAETLQQAIPLKERFTSALDILFDFEIVDLQRKGGIFLRATDGDYLDMFLLRGTFSEQFIAKEQRIALGACLCGRAAFSGELLVSDDCFCDPRHEHTFDGMQAHGHYIVPISAAGNTLGILFLYTDPYPAQNDSRLTMLKQVGELLALAVLQEQAKVSLENSRDMAMQTAVAKSEFLANMSHEIRTPMNGVLGMLDLLRDTDMSSSQWDLVDTAHASAESLLAIINDILDFFKLEAGKLEVEQIDFNLITLVGDVCTLLARQAHAKNLELNCFIPVDMRSHWLGDPNRIRQVLTNLIGNAIKFTEHGEVSVIVTCTPSIEEEADMLHFEIRDTGIGIASEMQAYLFQPFSQAESSTARRFGGTGLGLSISKNLVELMGGVLGLDSTLGHGTCFWFTLQLLSSDVVETDTLPLDNVGKRVLVVDDNTTNRMIINHYLTHWGFVVGHANNGRAALIELEHAIANHVAYDLVLLDMHMPEMDGLTLARMMTETPMLSKIPRILLSSGGGLMGDNERRELGFSHSLLKPVKQLQLFDAIVTSLNAAVQNTPIKAKVTVSTPSYQGKKLLVVEDNKVNQKVIIGLLAKFQLVPDIADNGQLALDKLAHNVYDLVLMDCQMPVLDGYQATSELRGFEGNAGLTHQPVIALTANAIAGEREKCLAAGMDDYLTKPISQKSLADILARWLSSPVLETKQLSTIENKQEITADSLWNKEAALNCLGGDEELLKGMIEAFFVEATIQLSELRQALDRNNLPDLANLAHTLKGSVSYFCAETAINCAAGLEHAARANQNEDYSQMTELLTKAIVDLMESLRQFLNEN
ncbi:MAG: response regulator [Methylococcales bacterium]